MFTLPLLKNKIYEKRGEKSDAKLFSKNHTPLFQTICLAIEQRHNLNKTLDRVTAPERHFWPRYFNIVISHFFFIPLFASGNSTRQLETCYSVHCGYILFFPSKSLFTERSDVQEYLPRTCKLFVATSHLDRVRCVLREAIDFH